MNYNTKTRSLEVSCKMFVDDMEEVLKRNFKTSVDLSKQQAQAQNKQMVLDYMQRNLAMSVDAKPAKLHFIGFEKEQESIYCYFEIENIPPPKKLNITNSIFYDYKNEQMNIVHVLVDGKRQSAKLNYPKREVVLSF